MLTYMPERKQAKKTTKTSAKTTTTTARRSSVLTDEERAAMKELAKERKAEERWKKDREAGEKDLLAKVAAMKEPDRSMAKRLHRIVTTTAPDLSPRTWYGMPAYSKDGKVLCFFQDAHKFKTRYSTFGFTDVASLDKGTMWPVYYALKELNDAEEEKIRALLKKAVS